MRCRELFYELDGAWSGQSVKGSISANTSVNPGYHSMERILGVHRSPQKAYSGRR